MHPILTIDEFVSRLEVEMPSGEVLKWRHDVTTFPFVDVAPSFVAFLERIAQDWTHFIEDDREWEYLAG